MDIFLKSFKSLFFIILIAITGTAAAQNKPAPSVTNNEADLVLYYNKFFNEFKIISNIDGTKTLDNNEALDRRGYSYCFVLFPDTYKNLGNPDTTQEIFLNEVEDTITRLYGKKQIKNRSTECINGNDFIGHNTANVVIIQRKAVPLLAGLQEFSNFELFSELKLENLKLAIKKNEEAQQKRANDEKLWASDIEKYASSDNFEKLGSITLSYKIQQDSALKICTSEYAGPVSQAISVYGEGVIFYTSAIFRKNAVKAEATFNKTRPYSTVFKNIDSFYKEYQRDNSACHVYVDFPKNLKQLMTAIERDQKAKAYEINTLVNVVELRETWAKKQGFNNLSDLDFAAQIGATPKVLATLNSNGISDKTTYEQILNEIRAAKYGEGKNLTEVMSYLEDKNSASKKNGATATSIKKEREAKLEKEAQIEKERLAEAQRIRNLPLTKATLNPSLEYKYYNDGTCTDSSGERCLNINQYKQICDFANGFTKRVRRGLGVYYNGDYSEFLSAGGTATNISYGWNGKTCVISFNITGTFKGTSHDKKFTGIVSTFVVTTSKEVLIDSAFFQ